MIHWFKSGLYANFVEVSRFGSPQWSLLWTEEEKGHRSPQVTRGRAKGWVCLSLSVMSDSAIPCSVAHQAPLSMGILQAILLERVVMPSSRKSSKPRGQTQSFTLKADSLLTEPPGQISGGNQSIINIDYGGPRAVSQILHNSYHIIRTLVKLDWGTPSRPHFNLITSLKTLSLNVIFWQIRALTYELDWGGIQCSL